MSIDTLDAYTNRYSGLVSYLADNATTGPEPPSDPAPPDLTSRAISLRVRLAFAFSNTILLTLMIARRFDKRLVSSSTVQVLVTTLGTS